MRNTVLSLLATILLLGGAIGIGCAVETLPARGEFIEHKTILVTAVLSVLWGCVVTKCYEILCQRKENR